MNGPIKKPKTGLGLGALEVWSVIFGLIVVVGVLLESGPEIWQSIRYLRIPSRIVIGGAMVALGVFGEVAIGVFIARSAKREQIESRERIAKAEQVAAEANLERTKLEARVAPRFLTMEERKEFTACIINASVKRVDLFAYGSEPEVLRLCQLIGESLFHAGWHFEVRVIHGNVGLAGTAVSVSDDADSDIKESAELLRTAVEQAGLDLVAKRWLHPKGAKPDHVIEDPPWNGDLSAPIRLLVGSKPLISRPVTPPQA